MWAIASQKQKQRWESKQLFVNNWSFFQGTPNLGLFNQLYWIMFSAVVTTSVLKQLSSTTPCLSARSRHEPKKKRSRHCKKPTKNCILRFSALLLLAFCIQKFTRAKCVFFCQLNNQRSEPFIYAFLCISLHLTPILCILSFIFYILTLFLPA